MEALSCFRCLLYRVHVSQPYRRLVRTTALYILSFVDCVMLCWFRKWPRAWLASQIRALISLSRLPTLLITLPRYFKSEVFQVVDRLQRDGGSVGNWGRCWLEQDLCLAEADGETCSRSLMAWFSTQVKNRL